MGDINFTLSNGVEVPAIGYGTYAPFEEKGDTYKSALNALRIGYRHIDCASHYGNEDAIGDAIADFLKERPSLSRKDLFITTKVWSHLHGEDGVQLSLNGSLSKFKLDYVDLLLIHWPIAIERDDKNPPEPKIGPDGKICYLNL